MRRALLIGFLFLSVSAVAQDERAAVRELTADERAFARLPQELRVALADLPAREALQKLDYARQNLIALGTPNPTPERLLAAVHAALAPRQAAVASTSAGTTSFPPLSPLVPANAFDYR